MSSRDDETELDREMAMAAHAQVDPPPPPGPNPTWRAPDEAPVEGAIQRALDELDPLSHEVSEEYGRHVRELARAAMAELRALTAPVEDPRIADVDYMAGSEAYCEVAPDKSWAGQYQCGIHDVWFRSEETPQACPVGELAGCICDALNGKVTDGE